MRRDRFTPFAIGSWALRKARGAALVVASCAWAVGTASAQAPQLVFTVAAPDRARTTPLVRSSAVVDERGLAPWAGSSTDLGVGVTLSGPHWTVRSITSLTAVPIAGHSRPTFQQVEVLRPLFGTGRLSVAGGGGIRQQWDGTGVLIGRALAGSDIGHGRLQGSVVLERALSSSLPRDAADVVTSLGWSRRVGSDLSVGVEGIGQDLEGFWNSAEAEGGAKLLVGPSLRLQPKSGDWTASLTAGPVMQTVSTMTPPDSRFRHGRHFGAFASATWTPSPRR